MEHMSLRERLISGLRDDPHRTWPRPPRRSRPPRPPWLAGIAAAAGAAGLAAAVAAISVSVLGQPPPPGPTVTSVLTDAVGHLNAVQLLINAANAAGRPQPVIVTSGQFSYFEGMVSFGSQGGPAPAQTHLQQVWRPATDLCAGGLVIEYGQRYSLTVRKKCPDHGQLQANPTYPLLRSLPTGPQALLATLRTVKYPGVPADEAAFSTIGNIQESVVPPDVSAALYRAAALLPEITAGPSAYDPIGRPGVTVSFILGGVEEQWIFDPDTLRLLGEAGFSNGVMTSESAILNRAIVDRAGELPSGG
ncbi:MAG TPA: CU044_5270 family protein [Streptosporangiaceae bacterium]